jgi:urease accessory protein
MTTAKQQDDLYKLLSWLSPAFPIGSYAYSHGIEYAVEEGLVTSKESLGAWIKAILCEGSGKTEGWVIKTAYAAAVSGASLDEVISYALTLKATPELWHESSQQGAAFLKILLQTEYSTSLAGLEKLLRGRGEKPSFALVFGLLVAEHKIELESALCAFLHGMASSLVSAGVRLVPLGQRAGQEIIKDLAPVIFKLVEVIFTLSLEELGSATPMVDWSSSRHETQYTRIFQS